MINASAYRRLLASWPRLTLKMVELPVSSIGWCINWSHRISETFFRWCWTTMCLSVDGELAFSTRLRRYDGAGLLRVERHVLDIEMSPWVPSQAVESDLRLCSAVHARLWQRYPTNLQRGPKKWGHRLVTIILSNLNRLKKIWLEDSLINL